MKAWRFTLAVAGILLGLYGAAQLLAQVRFADLLVLALWLIGAVALHDGVIAPATVGIGWALHRVLPARVRRYVQAFLISGALVSVVAIPLIVRRGSQPEVKAILQQNYGANLTLLLAILAGLSLLAYAADRSLGRGHPGESAQDADPPSAPSAG